MPEITLDGVTVALSYEEYESLKEKDTIDVSVLVDSKEHYPVIAEGKFDSSGVWRFFKSRPSSSPSFDADYEFEKFIEGVEEAIETVF